LAAITRIKVVAPMVARYGRPRPPNVVRASCEMTVSASDGTAPIGPAR
jgi:hypothetical protein